jgi:hypothetical protein
MAVPQWTYLHLRHKYVTTNRYILPTALEREDDQFAYAAREMM